MLRIFHTADWHLGQTFHGHDRGFEHARFLDWLLEQLDQRRPDALILAGDVFDTINPSAAAQRLYFQFLSRVHEIHPDLQTVIVAGNHDAGSRLEAPRELLQAFRIHVVGTVPRTAEGHPDPERMIVRLTNADGQTAAYVLAVPFLRPADVPMVEGTDDPWLAGIHSLYHACVKSARVLRDKEAPNAALLGMGHCHLSGGTESPDSERRLVIGNAECVGLETFPEDLAYVALGHLHRAQSFREGRIQYSGSPLPLSFSERAYKHRVVELCVEGPQNVSFETLPVPRAVAMLSVPKTGAATRSEILTQLQDMDSHAHLPLSQQPFLEIRVSQDGPDPTFRPKVDSLIADRGVRLVSIKQEAEKTHQSQFDTEQPPSTELLASLRPEDVFSKHWRDEYGTEPDPEVVEVLRTIMLEAGGAE